MRIKEFFLFIKERHSIYLRRQKGAAKPWTQDPILRQYRFCNMYRELDTVTMWIRENWREPFAGDEDLWFAMAVARLLNLPSSMAAVGYPVPWSAGQFKKILALRKARGEKIFNGAYLVRADAVDTRSKADYLADKVLTPLWKRRDYVRPREGDTLATFHARLMEFRDMGSFMAAQVVADTKYAGILQQAEDWDTWAAPGPGSLRGLNRAIGRALDETWKPERWLAAVQELNRQVNILLRKNTSWEPFHAQDTQNQLCEFDKYERVRLCEGRPKRLYAGI